MRRLTIALLATALTVTAACSGGDKSSTESSDGPARTLFQPAGVVGPDSFAPTFAVSQYEVEPSDVTSDEVSGTSPGLYAGRTYGGTGTNICDVEAMISFLTFYEERGRAWAAIQGIDFSELESYLRSLTPVFALQNLRVQMFGFKNGQSYGYEAVMEAGTAILVDDEGMPRARCACGNPLLGPSEQAPEGTDVPTPDDPDTPEDGNPQTQDSVPPDDSVPGQPEQPQDPECPEWNSDPITYTDPTGGGWIYDRSTNSWFSTTDPDATGLSTEELPGYLENCGQPERPDPLECPEPINGIGTMDWTPYRSSTGDLWLYDAATESWINQTTGDEVAGFDPSAIPGYLDDCGEPTTTEVPCPPVQPALGDTWTDPDTGETWLYEVVATTDDGGVRLAWTNLTTNDERRADELYADECGDPVGRKTVCPPIQAALGTVWIDSTGDEWIYAAGSGGAAGWDRVATSEIETLTYQDLPNKPSGCPEPRRQFECPPILDVPEGFLWFGRNGDVFRYSTADGGWVNESDPSAPVVAFTAILPGYRELCLPPCPPLNVLRTGEFALWVDPSNGDVWVKMPTDTVWTNTTTGDTLTRTKDLPFYAEDCLPPCDPTSDGGATFVVDESGVPQANPQRQNEFVDAVDSAVTVTPGTGEVDPQRIVPQRLTPSMAIGDDCNPDGCVESGAEPEVGHSFRDSSGAKWKYIGGGSWQSENGDVVADVLDIPGYAEACSPPDTPVERECPDEFEGATYTDTSGLVWTWTGFNDRGEDSDHGQHWYHRYEDGSFEKRYTFELEGFFEDCPRPEDVDVQAAEVSVTLRAATRVCVGTETPVTMIVTTTGTGIVDGDISSNGDTLATSDLGDGKYEATVSADEVGTLTIVGRASDVDGNEGSATTSVIVEACDDQSGTSLPEQPNSPNDPTTTAPATTAPATTTAPTTTMPAKSAPTVTLNTDFLNPLPQCIPTNGTTVSFKVGDSEPNELVVTLRFGDIVRTTRVDITPGKATATATFSIPVTAAGRSFTVVAEDEGGSSSEALTGSFTSQVCQ